MDARDVWPGTPQMAKSGMVSLGRLYCIDCTYCICTSPEHPQWWLDTVLIFKNDNPNNPKIMSTVGMWNKGWGPYKIPASCFLPCQYRRQTWLSSHFHFERLEGIWSGRAKQILSFSQRVHIPKLSSGGAEGRRSRVGHIAKDNPKPGNPLPVNVPVPWEGPLLTTRAMQMNLSLLPQSLDHREGMCWRELFVSWAQGRPSLDTTQLGDGKGRSQARLMRWFEWAVTSIDLNVWMLGPQLVIMLG